MPIDFPDKLRSTRRDQKLVDAAAIDGLIQAAQLAADARDGGSIVTGGIVGLTSSVTVVVEGRYHVATADAAITVQTPTPSAADKYIIIYNVPTGEPVTVQTNETSPLHLITLQGGEAVLLRSTGTVAGAWHPIASHTPDRADDERDGVAQNLSAIEALQSITRDLHGGSDDDLTENTDLAVAAMWAGDPDDIGDASALTWALGAQRPGASWGADRIVVRLAATATRSEWHVKLRYRTSDTYYDIPGSSWTPLTPAGAEDGYTYWVAFGQNGIGSHVSHASLWSQGRPITYVGALGSGIVTLDSLAAAVAARLLPTRQATDVGEILRVDSGGAWDPTQPSWTLEELAAAVQARLLPPPSLPNAGKVPTVDSSGGSYVFEESGAQVATDGLRIEKIKFSNRSGSTATELTPISTGAIEVVHGEGDAELITGIVGNDFTVKAGLYLMTIVADVAATQVGVTDFDIRAAADDRVIAGPTGFTTYRTDSTFLEFTTTGFWHLKEDTLVNLLVDPHGRNNSMQGVELHLAQLAVDDRSHILRLTEPLNPDRAALGDILLSNHAFRQLSTAGAADVFAGEVEAWTDGDAHYLGTASGPNRYGSRGRFTANPGFAIAALTAGGDDATTVAIRIKKTAYEAAKGSAVAAGDTVILEITVDGATTRTTVTYIRTEDDLVAFLAHDEDSALHDLTDGGTWTMKVLSAYDEQAMSGTSLLTHEAGAKHFVNYPVEGIDPHARELAQGLTSAAKIRVAHGSPPVSGNSVEDWIAYLLSLAQHQDRLTMRMLVASTGGLSDGDPVYFNATDTGVATVHATSGRSDAEDTLGLHGIEGLSMGRYANGVQATILLKGVYEIWVHGGTADGNAQDYVELDTPIYYSHDLRYRGRKTSGNQTHWTTEQSQSLDNRVYGRAVATNFAGTHTIRCIMTFLHGGQPVPAP
ncbi:MAG: hypothetical protein F4060_15405 [Holophagales bacterium]|nr:hypothetical protein [Holophagales bacterium]MYG29340.1 hypothetical protein [Holophagales bacterium]MYI81315.1 hypothetical protein [Holophagales bacterium]